MEPQLLVFLVLLGLAAVVILAASVLLIVCCKRWCKRRQTRRIDVEQGIPDQTLAIQTVSSLIGEGGSFLQPTPALPACPWPYPTSSGDWDWELEDMEDASFSSLGSLTPSSTSSPLSSSIFSSLRFSTSSSDMQLQLDIDAALHELDAVLEAATARDW